MGWMISDARETNVGRVLQSLGVDLKSVTRRKAE